MSISGNITISVLRLKRIWALYNSGEYTVRDDMHKSSDFLIMNLVENIGHIKRK